MSETRIGCSGWSYKTWVGPFYPQGTKQGDFLKLYSRVFDTVEIDSTFYTPPSEMMINRWSAQTPHNFLFCPKMYGKVTHDNKLNNVEVILRNFLDNISKLGSKLGPVLIQMPPSFSFDKGVDSLKEFLPLLPKDLHFAIEFRHNSWFVDSTYSLLSDNNVTLAWSEIPMAKNPGVLTSDKVYLRLVGDRSIKESDFGKVQRDKDLEINKWAGMLDDKKDDIEKAYVYSNNHFQGFGPASANLMARALGLEERNFNSITNFIQSETKQKTLF